MNKFTVVYTDKTEFSGDPFNHDWNKMPVTKQISKLVYLLGNQIIVMSGFKEYNHCIEKLGLQAKGISKILLMGRREKDTLIITFDLMKNKIFQKMSVHGKEYGVQILAGWKEGKLNKPKAYLKKSDNVQ